MTDILPSTPKRMNSALDTGVNPRCCPTMSEVVGTARMVSIAGGAGIPEESICGVLTVC